ncbi:Hypothetical predicted protein [Marmota monax]|uniref:Uncharacterized protein n=1 Tax=Marmota monax TaxID=9995 RepID=A0A5E4CPZ4_MARMO|nr:hypothetical protein GHT09_012187 [Marmota monax]VTJ83847.1 Hypothetical predicted protein [Marmota monax]
MQYSEHTVPKSTKSVVRLPRYRAPTAVTVRLAPHTEKSGCHTCLNLRMHLTKRAPTMLIFTWRKKQPPPPPPPPHPSHQHRGHYGPRQERTPPAPPDTIDSSDRK